jgi:hypothetical protein
MASQGDPIQRHASTPPSTPPAPPATPAGIDLTTLFLSAVASAAAAYITSKIWAPGTLFSAAMSPVIVALVKEGLRKPTEVVTAAVPGVAKPLRSSTSRVGAGRTLRVPSDPGPVQHTLPDDLPERLERGAPPPLPPPQAGAQAGPVRVYSTRANRMRLRLAIVTGLLAFAIVVAFYTVPELIAGQSVGRSGHATTFFPGKAKKHTNSTTTTSTSTTQSDTTKSDTTTSESKTATQPTQTVTQTVTTPAPPPPDTSTTPVQPAPQQTPATPAPATPDQPPATTTP